MLSSADLGRAYLSEAWATNFVRNLLERYTVVLVGYQAEDPPVRYLLQGLKSHGEHDPSRLYVFDKGLPEEIEAKWRDRGATAIAFADYTQLWQSTEAWAKRADDPRGWRALVISNTSQGPKSMKAHERGQVAHVLRTVQGARLLSNAGSAVHPEWICVLDANIRTAEQRSSHGDDDRTFDARLAYGLDDDLERISGEDGRRGVGNDNLLVWRPGDDNPHEFHRLGERQVDGAEKMPTRLRHLVTWITKSVHSPVLAWWAIRQTGLHPRLLHCLHQEISRDEDLHDRARHVWNLILEHHRDPRNRQRDRSWFQLRKRIAAEGWSASVLRDFRQASRPRVEIKPSYAIGDSGPPASDWDSIRLGHLGRFEIRILVQYNDVIKVPDTALPQVFKILEDQLAAASGLLSDVGTVHFTPTCYPGREVDGTAHSSEAAEVMTLFRGLFDRIAKARPELARAHAVTWPETDCFYFRKLKLYGYSMKPLFDADYVADAVLSLDQDAFWDMNVVRELLFLLVDRWPEISPVHKARLSERILEGPDRRPHWPVDEYPRRRNELSARYGRYLELRGGELPPDHHERLFEIIAKLPDWNDRFATSTVTERGVHVVGVGIDETPDALLDLPVNKVVAEAERDQKGDFAGFTRKQSFKGLVKVNPRKALLALTLAAKSDKFPRELWSAMIDEMRVDIKDRVALVFMHRLARLPNDAIKELPYPLGRWLERDLASILEFDEDLAWSVYDRIVDGILSGGEEATMSGLGDFLQGGDAIPRSRRTHEHAINGPVGMCAEALFSAVPGDTQEEGSLIPDHVRTRLDRLFSAPGEGSDHAVSVTTSKLNWLMHVDPEWTERRVVPMLAFDDPAAEPAWNGFLSQGRPPMPALAVLVKPLLLDLHPWIDKFAWDRDIAHIAGLWLGCMHFFLPKQPAGLTKHEMRSALREMGDDARNRFILWLGEVAQEEDEGWAKLVIPFIDEVWPRERRYRTSSSATSWLRLLEDTDESFPAVYAAVKKFLVPVDPDSGTFFRFADEFEDEETVTSRFPEDTLDLMDTVTRGVPTRPPYELPRILEIIVETDPSLASDRRYLRLIDLVELS